MILTYSECTIYRLWVTHAGMNQNFSLTIPMHFGNSCPVQFKFMDERKLNCIYTLDAHSECVSFISNGSETIPRYMILSGVVESCLYVLV